MSMKKDYYLHADDRTELFVQADVRLSDKAILIMCHGLNEYHGCFHYLTEVLHEAGFGTLCPDHRGHGKSGGERGHLDSFFQLPDDLNATFELIHQEFPDAPLFLFGHSMGGLAAALYGLLHSEQPLRGILLSAPVLCDHQGLFHALEPGEDVHHIFPLTLHDEICTISARVRKFKEDPLATLFNTAGTAYEIAAGTDWFRSRMKDFHFPLLIMHGSSDMIVSPKDSDEFFSRAGSADRQLKLYGGARHALFNEFCREEMASDMIHWMLNRL